MNKLSERLGRERRKGHVLSRLSEVWDHYPNVDEDTKKYVQDAIVFSLPVMEETLEDAKEEMEKALEDVKKRNEKGFRIR